MLKLQGRLVLRKFMILLSAKTVLKLLAYAPFGQLQLLQRWLLTLGRFFDRYKYLEHLHWFRTLGEKKLTYLTSNPPIRNPPGRIFFAIY